jgi:hypothetical protein
MRRSTILHIQLAEPKAVDVGATDGYSWLINAFIAHVDRVVLAFGAPGIRKDQSMGRLYSSLRRRSDGCFRIELGATLADKLPALESDEYLLDVRLDSEDHGKKLCFSNQMVRLRYKDADGEMLTGITPLVHLQRAFETPGVPTATHIEYLPTMVTAQYELAGEDAEDALSAGLETAIDDFIARINRMLAAHLMVAPLDTGILTPTYDRSTFESFFLLVTGEEERLEGNVLGLSLFRVGRVVKNYDAEVSSRIRSLAAAEEKVDDVAQYFAPRRAISRAACWSSHYLSSRWPLRSQLLVLCIESTKNVAYRGRNSMRYAPILLSAYC